MEISEAVQTGANLMADVEAKILSSQAQLSGLDDVFRSVHLSGKIGYLEYLSLSAEARALAGDLAATESSVVEFHRRLTARCVELGIDDLLPQPRSGGGGR